MTTVEFITALFSHVDEPICTIPKHPEACLRPSAASYPHLFIYEGADRIMQYMVVRSLRC
jgi:hypothetical protein